MIPRRGRGDPLEPARRALAEGRYEAAFALLEHAAHDAAGGPVRALYRLHLAAADALYGPAGLDRGVQALRQAVASDPSVVRRPLYRALHWEFRALQGAAAHEVRSGVARIGEDDPVASYHAASALWLAGAGRSARTRLAALRPASLPAYLRWRRASLRGHVLAEAGAFEEAADAFELAYGMATPLERAPVALHWAAALLELGFHERVRELLEPIAPERLEPVDRGWALELLGRADLELGNPGRALARFDAAEASVPDGERRFSLQQARAQTLARMGRHAEAAACLGEVIDDAPVDERSFALHEQAVVLLEADELDAAEGVLEELMVDPDYPHHAEATADLAEIRLRKGDLPAARETAAQALELGAVGPACLTLGTIAFEYFDLDEAIVWLERTVSATTAGEPSWVAAHQLLADVHAQRGSPAAESLLLHARRALEHSEPGSEWIAPLQAHVDRARRWLGGADRWLN